MSGPDVTPKTESGRALLSNFSGTSAVASDVRRRILAIEQEAASKAVAEVLDRLEARVESANPLDSPQSSSVSLPKAKLLALIASERKP